jgi:hypothetical protein
MRIGRVYLGVAFVASALLVGCEKKQDSNPVDPGNTTAVPVPGASISGVQRTRVINSLQTFMDSVHRVNPTALRSALLNYFNSKPEFQSAGMAEDGSVYGVFTDGRLMIYGVDFPDDASVAPAGASPIVPKRTNGLDKIGSDFPSSNDAIFMYSRYSPNDTYNSTFETFTGHLEHDFPIVFDKIKTAYNYVPKIATIDELKKVSGAGIFHWATHGGEGKLADKTTDMYSLMTAEVYNNGKDTVEYKDDFAQNRLTYFAGGIKKDSAGAEHLLWYYGITPAFVAKYMSFSQNSLVFIFACTSYNPLIIDGFRKAQASAYLGWDKPVLISDGYYASVFFFDRCFGTNVCVPFPSPPQRPFEYQYVYDDINFRGKAVSTYQGKAATLRYTQLSGNLDVLLPTIQLVSFVNYGTYLKMTVDGNFGSVPGQVLLNGLPLTLSKPWKSNTLETDMPVGGGNIQVVVNGKKSNVVQLTQWNGTVTYTLTSTGSLTRKMIANVSFLADVHRYHRLPGANIVYKDEAVFGGNRIVAPLTTITCTYDCSGSDKDVSWSGSGTISNIQPDPVTTVPGGFLMGTIGDEGQTTMIDFMATGYYTVKTGTSSSQQKFSSADNGFASMQFPIGTGFLIKAGRIVTPTSFGTATTEWTDFKPFAPPDPNAAR